MDLSSGIEAYLLPYSQVITVVSTAIIAISAVVTAALTWRLICDNRNLAKVGTEPEVVAYLGADPYQLFTNFVLANVGRGPAKNIEFYLDLEEHHYDRIILRNETESKTPRIPSSRRKEGRCFSATIDCLGLAKNEKRTRYNLFELWFSGRT